MAVAAYASLVSLMHVLDNVQHPARRHRLHLDKERIKSLQEKVQFLQDFLELHSQGKSQEMEDLAREITVVAHDADDVIDLHVVDQLCQESQDNSHHMAALSSFCQDLDILIEKIESITKKLMMIKEEWGDDVQEQTPVVSVPVNSGKLSFSGKNTIVGFDKHLLHIVDELTKDESNLRILPIVGMGGIGKTTLAQNAFDHSYIVNHFDVRIWLTISQEYSVQEILLHLLNDKKDQGSSEVVVGLGERVHKKLFGRRYLIVMDDIWSTKVWDELSMFFPNNGNGSRIMMTTRMSKVVVTLGCQNPYLMNFLNEEESWDLLCEKVFAQKGRPYPELEKIGKNIANCCRGLPLAIVVISGLLVNSNMQYEYWKSIAENVNTFANSQDNEHCLKILSLSYNYLPIHLKPCFLYMCVFPEDYQIRVSELVKKWIGEGFIKPERGKILEEIANGYLEELVDRNLILIRERTFRGRIKSCSIHDLLRDLCLREFDKGYFVRKVQFDQHFSFACSLCRQHLGELQAWLCFPLVSVGSPSTSCRLKVCGACKLKHPNITKLRLARVLNHGYIGDEMMLEPTKLRYLSHLVGYNVTFRSTSIRLFWNLQSLLLDVYVYYHDNPIVLPNEIWGMPQLRHLELKYASLPDPVATQGPTILENLHTLSGILNFKLSEEVLERIPNLKKLKVDYHLSSSEKWSDYCLHNLAYLHKLESLSLSVLTSSSSENMESQERLSLISGHMAFPDSLKRLSLEDSRIPWEDMTVVGSLPNLEVLKLWSYAFEGPEWNSKEEQFPRLKVLYIFESDLAWWRAESSHFPNLQRLILRRMAYLNEIPSDIGDIATLRSIQVYRCSRSAAISAKQIEREQHDNCNELEVHVNSRLPKMWKPVFNVLRFAFRLTKLSGYVPPREKVGSIVEES